MNDKPSDALDAAIKEADDEERTITVLGKTFGLISELSVPVTHGIYKAQKDEDLALLIDTTAKMVVQKDRQAFVDHILGDHDDGAEIGMEEFNTIFQEALEKVVGRPLEQS